MRLLLVMLMLAAVSGPARADPLPGPVAAEVLRVIDGDTFVARALVWPGHFVEVSVRIRDIDAPETRSGCAAEREAGARARASLARLLGSGHVALTNVGGGKYHGRILADVANEAGANVAALMLQMGHARPYRGGKRISLCSDP